MLLFLCLFTALIIAASLIDWLRTLLCPSQADPERHSINHTDHVLDLEL